MPVLAIATACFRLASMTGFLEDGTIAELWRQGRRAVARAEQERDAALGQAESERVDDFAREIDVENGEIEVEAGGEVERPNQARHARHHRAAHLLQHGLDVERHQRFVFDQEDLQRANVRHGAG